jgi:hypothetical protein
VDFLHQLTSRSALLALGVSLCFVGIVLRGFVRDGQRARARRKQEWLHHRKPGDIDPTDHTLGWFDRNLPLIANTTALTGAAITLASFFRH